MSTAPRQGRPGDLPCIRMDVPSVFEGQMSKDGLDSGSGCAHVSSLTGEAGSEAGNAAHEQTHYFSISKVCMNC